MDKPTAFTPESHMTPEQIAEWETRLEGINIRDAYTNSAKRLLKKALPKEECQVKIDHLAFSFKLMEFRHCHRAGFAGYTSQTQNYFPQPPKLENYTSDSIDDIEKHKLKQHAKLADFYEQTLHVFVEKVLGFRCSLPRGKGFHGYKDSMTLLSKNGVEVGFVGIGGQQETIYFQISGTGCKHLFDFTDGFRLHHWLSKVLSITTLSRVDLACDDYDNIYHCDYAESAYTEGMFRTGSGGKLPVISPSHSYTYDANGQKQYSVEMLCVGKRTSPVFWRIYNKKLEQGIKQDDLTWYRSEVELKKWNVDVLLNPDAAFAGINAFAQTLVILQGERTKSMSPSKEVCLDLASRVKWFRHASGKALGDILELLDGDISKAIGLILPDETGNKLGIPPTYKQLLEHAMEH